jgi:UDP-GlcNAc:undecaprenyl-phosphate GlcNAc-1-phosphate transferase
MRERWMHYDAVYMLNAFLLAVVLIQALSPIAARVGLLDIPQGRKMHEHPVPATGGLAMFGAFVLPLTLLWPPWNPDWSLLIGLLTLVLVGAIDDAVALGPWTKLGGQVAAALAMTLPGHHLIGTSIFLGGAGDGLPQMQLVVTVCFVVGVVNAFNMLDGLDGLAGGAAAVALLGLAIVASLSGIIAARVDPLLLLCAVLGFLVFNLRHRWRPRASVHMGDAGSMMLGGAIAYFAVVLSTGPEKSAALPVLLWLFALPLFDMLILMVRRAAAGDNPLQGDRRHLHHLLLQAGLPPRLATAILIAACSALGGAGLIGWRLGVPGRLMLLGLALPFILHAYVVLQGWKVIRRLRDARATGASAETRRFREQVRA